MAQDTRQMQRKDTDTWIEVSGARGEALKAVQGHALLRVASSEPTEQEDLTGTHELCYHVPPEYMSEEVLWMIARRQHAEYGNPLSYFVSELRLKGAYVRAEGCTLS